MKLEDVKQIRKWSQKKATKYFLDRFSKLQKKLQMKFTFGGGVERTTADNPKELKELMETYNELKDHYYDYIKQYNENFPNLRHMLNEMAFGNERLTRKNINKISEIIEKLDNIEERVFTQRKTVSVAEGIQNLKSEIPKELFQEILSYLSDEDLNEIDLDKIYKMNENEIEKMEKMIQKQKPKFSFVNRLNEAIKYDKELRELSEQKEERRNSESEQKQYEPDSEYESDFESEESGYVNKFRDMLRQSHRRNLRD